MNTGLTRIYASEDVSRRGAMAQAAGAAEAHWRAGEERLFEAMYLLFTNALEKSDEVMLAALEGAKVEGRGLLTGELDQLGALEQCLADHCPGD